MGLFKADLYRFFAFGFAAGAVLVATTMTTRDVGRVFADGVAPRAEAAVTPAPEPAHEPAR